MDSLYNKKAQIEIPSHRKLRVLRRLYEKIDDETIPFEMYVGMSRNGITTITIEATTKPDAIYFGELLELCAKEG
jgi:hypothetical protein